MNLDAFQSVAPSTSSSGAPPTERKVTRPTKPKLAPYLSGPVPMSWLAEAVTAGGAALALGVSLWFQRGMRKRFGPILRVDKAVRKVMNLTADQSRRAVTALAARGLIHVHTGGRGRCAEVEILDPPGAAPSVDLRKPRDDARRGGAGQAPWREPYHQPPTTQRGEGAGGEEDTSILEIRACNAVEPSSEGGAV